MRLDSGAMRALSVDPQPGEADKNASLLGIFSQCKTAMGSRLLRKWLRQPLVGATSASATTSSTPSSTTRRCGWPSATSAYADGRRPRMHAAQARKRKAQLQVTGRHRRHRRHLRHCHRHLLLHHPLCRTSSSSTSSCSSCRSSSRCSTRTTPRRQRRPRQAQVRRAAPPRHNDFGSTSASSRAPSTSTSPPARVHRASVGGGGLGSLAEQKEDCRARSTSCTRSGARSASTRRRSSSRATRRGASPTA